MAGSEQSAGQQPPISSEMSNYLENENIITVCNFSNPHWRFGFFLFVSLEWEYPRKEVLSSLSAFC